MDSDHQNLLLHSELGWLSFDKVLKRLYELRKEVDFKDKKFVVRLACLSDKFSFMNEVNLQLNGPDTKIFSVWNKNE
jgi:hypothetical protein